jgi:DNA segregation ATPase FtsK/SpoIIIE, S-DNA-T family
MANRRCARSDWIAWAFLGIGLVLTLCIFGHEAPTGEIATTAQPDNLLGPPGAWLAQELFNALGVSVYVLLTGWLVLVILRLARRQSTRLWFVRLAGWLILLPCAAVAADWIGPERLGGPITGSGGAVGAWLTAWLDEEFIPLGASLLFAGAVLLGLTLAADAVVRAALRLLFRILIVIGKLIRGMGRVLIGAGDTTPGKASGKAAVRLYAPLEPDEAPEDPPSDPDIIPITYPETASDDAPARPASPTPSEPVLLPINRPEPPAHADIGDEARFQDFELPPLSLLEEPAPFPYAEHDHLLREKAALLEKTFKDFELNVRVVGINTGPVITQYEITLETGLRVNKVTNLGDDLALNLKVPTVRIVAPIPGKNTVGIEIPNEHRATVRLKEVILTGGKKSAAAKIPLFLGKDTEGRPLIYDLADMPHLLIAGRTGTGKSVCLNAIILSILMTRRPDEVKLILIDPKMNELTEYGKIPHLMHPVVKDIKKAEAILSWAVDKMEERYDILSRARVRSVGVYNELGRDEILRRIQPEPDEADHIPQKMPYIVIVVDEMNDLMMQMKREVEGHIIRLAQKSRAAGIHLCVATQKPTVDIITGLIKSNLPARICFQVSSRTDSRVVLDEMGADKLLGKGDMLFLQPGTSTILRAQGTYASDREITQVVGHLECDPCFAPELIQLKTSGESGGMQKRLREDDMYEPAVEVVVREGRGSVSLLQRALGIGYGRASRFIDFMAEDGIVGAYNGSSAREVLVTPEEWHTMKQDGAATAGS